MDGMRPSGIFFFGLGVQFVGGIMLGIGIADDAAGALFLGWVIVAAGFWTSVIGAGAWAVEIGTRHLRRADSPFERDIESGAAERTELQDSAGRRNEVLAFLAANPGAKPSEVARALGRDTWDVTSELQEGKRKGLTTVASAGEWSLTTAGQAELESSKSE